MTKKHQGKLIVIEGCDGAGKETQTKMLINILKMKNLKVETVAFPRYFDTVGGKLLAISLGKTDFAPDFEFSKLEPVPASLLYTMDRVESKKYIEDLLDQNDVVVLDRYFTANLLHQGAKFELEEDRNHFIENFTKIELEMFKIPKPDIIIYLQIPYEISIRRINERSATGVQKKDLVEKDLEYIKRSNKKGVSIAKYCGWEIINGLEENKELDRETISSIVLSKIENSF